MIALWPQAPRVKRRNIVCVKRSWPMFLSLRLVRLHPHSCGKYMHWVAILSKKMTRWCSDNLTDAKQEFCLWVIVDLLLYWIPFFPIFVLTRCMKTEKPQTTCCFSTKHWQEWSIFWHDYKSKHAKFIYIKKNPTYFDTSKIVVSK